MSYTCGTGAWSGPLPGDPDTNAILTATPVFGGIDVTWTDAVINPHAVVHTYLYRSTSADFATAIRIATVGGTHYYDKLDTLVWYYYWIQVVSINGTVGPVIGPASAVPRLSIEETIQALTGRIDSGVLAQSLKQDIDKISLINGDLFQEIQDRITANELLGAAIQSAQEDASQAVSIIYDEVTQRTTAYNVLLQSLNTMAGQVNDNQAAIQNESTLRISNDEALAQQITDVQSAVGDDIAAVQTTLQTNINTVNGKVIDIGALYTAKVKVNGLIGGFGVYNDGAEVQAGFDVDTFWVGRTGPDKKKPFIIDSGTGEVFIDNAVIRQLTADKIDSRGLSIKDADGNIILAAGTNLDWSHVNGVGKPQNGATRNVFVGNWTNGVSYVVGDTVMRDGNGWSCNVGHTASLGNQPPSTGGVGNTWWTPHTVKGAAGDSVDIIFQRAASQPATPAVSASVPSGWYSDISSVPPNGNLMWSCVGTKASGATNYTWQLPLKIEGSNGASGSNGLSIAELTVFRRSASAPATPTGGTYSFLDKTLTPPSGWSVNIPAGADPVYASRSVVSSTYHTATSVAPGTWSSPVVSFQNGTQGLQGLTGERGSLNGYGSKYSISSSSWSNNQAQAVIYNMIYGTAMTTYSSTGHLRIGDTVTLSNGSSFAETRYWGGTSWLSPGVVIDGNLLVSGTVSASKISAGTMDANGIVINSTYGSVGFGNSSSGGIVANFLASSANQYGVYVSSGKLGVTQGYYFGGSGTIKGGLAGNADQDSGMSGEKSAVGFQTKGVSSHGLRAKSSSGTASGIVGSNASYDFYAEGTAANYGPFTGAHDALIHKDLPIQLGDIVCDVQRVTGNGWSNVLFKVAYSDAANQPAVGVLIHVGPLLSASCCLSSFNTPVIAIDDFGNEIRENQADYDAFKDDHKTAIVNALGEGQINVCGEGGDIENGDLIATSSMLGKGMRQSDSNVRNYTVAKAREAVTFSSPAEVKQVACIYLCG